jgi:hypothetical protein
MSSPKFMEQVRTTARLRHLSQKNEKAYRNTFKSHPWKWVDSSDPTYQDASADPLLNPTHRSGWMVQIQPNAAVS